MKPAPESPFPDRAPAPGSERCTPACGARALADVPVAAGPVAKHRRQQADHQEQDTGGGEGARRLVQRPTISVPVDPSP